jgi:hypothetical protein
MPRDHVLNGFFFALWIAVCAASPEFLWQGFVSLSHHFTWASAAAALLIGVILAFFVEPVVERLRGLKSPDLHEHKSPALAACTSLSFAVVAVCVHEAITVYVDASHTNEQADQNVVYALSQALQWAGIPFAITVAWLAARSKLWIKLPLTAIAVLVIFLTGRCFEWSTRDLVTTAIPCALILAGGYVSVRRRWTPLPLDAAPASQLSLRLDGLPFLVCCKWDCRLDMSRLLRYTNGPNSASTSAFISAGCLV